MLEERPTATYPDPKVPGANVSKFKHAHAHLASDGFHAALNALEKKRLIALVALATPTLAEQKELKTLTARDGYDGREGLHLDPHTKKVMDPTRQVMDEQGTKMKGGKVVPNTPYADRPNHSQFEDSEIAAMALFYLLRSDAGKDALKELKTAKDNRVTIFSKSAANALNDAHNIKYLGKSPPVNHPNYQKQPMVIERKKGPAGTVSKTANIDYVSATLEMKVNPTTKENSVHLITMYPGGAKPTVANDLVNYKDAKGKKVTNAHIAYGAAKKPLLMWDDGAPPAPGQCKNANLVCQLCGQQHAPNLASWFYRRYWHKCRRCGMCFCDECGANKLVRPGVTRERLCPRQGCGGRTFLLGE